MLFAPTPIAAANLAAEAVAGSVHVTGNSGIDAVLAIAASLPSPTPHHGGVPRLLVTCHRRESWNEGLQSIAAALVELAADARIDFIRHPNGHVSDRMEQLLGGASNIRLIGPCDHAELVRRMRDADLVLSDSGGIQEEAPALGVPLLVLRDKTERPEGIAAGNAILVGTSTKRIIAAARGLLADPAKRAAMSQRSFPYGDGRASARIAEIVEGWLESRGLITSAVPRAG